MLAAVDDSLRLLVSSLQKKGIWNDTILVVTTDNGAMVDAADAFPASAGVNFPLRAGKGTVFEGGVRAIGFLQGGDNTLPSVARGQVVSEPLLHIVDWFPTLLNMTACGLALPDNLDGKDLWDVLVNNVNQTVRTVLPVNINFNISFPNSGYQVAIIQDHWKLVLQQITGPVLLYDGWYPPPPANYTPAPPNPTPGKFLFDLAKDPNEYHNLYQQELNGRVKDLEATLHQLVSEYVPPQQNEFHLKGMPLFHDGEWAPFI